MLHYITRPTGASSESWFVQYCLVIVVVVVVVFVVVVVVVVVVVAFLF